MPMKPREMIKLLQENGFVEVSQNGFHKTMIKPEADIPPIIVPTHSKELKIGEGTAKITATSGGISTDIYVDVTGSRAWFENGSGEEVSVVSTFELIYVYKLRN